MTNHKYLLLLCLLFLLLPFPASPDDCLRRTVPETEPAVQTVLLPDYIRLAFIDGLLGTGSRACAAADTGIRDLKTFFR